MQSNAAHSSEAATADDRRIARGALEHGAGPDPGDEGGPRRPFVEVGVLLAIALLLVVDFVDDAAKTSTLHVGVEVAATALALAAALRTWLRWVAARRALGRQVDELRGRLGVVSAEAERWRAEAKDTLQGLGAAIERQCDRWALTEAERAVAVLLLKGLSMKEIADARGTAERTTRQQALAVYRKAGLTGRAELAAFFLEDLLLPSSPTSSNLRQMNEPRATKPP
jgi:DNA-binding CsgD family transcriptional regulator